jgi:hypothetical protein
LTDRHPTVAEKKSLFAEAKPLSFNFSCFKTNISLDFKNKELVEIYPYLLCPWTFGAYEK